MGIWEWLGLGSKGGSAERTSVPQFEQLEPRLLLSSDPVSLLAPPLVMDHPAEAVIVVDLSPDEQAGYSDTLNSSGVEFTLDTRPVAPEEATGKLSQPTICGVRLSDIAAFQDSVAERDKPGPASDTDAGDQVQRHESDESILESSTSGSVGVRGPPGDAREDSGHGALQSPALSDNSTDSSDGVGVRLGGNLDLTVEFDVATPFEFTVFSDRPSKYTLLLSGESFEILDDRTGGLLARKPISETSAIVIQGVDNLDDTLTVDFHGGLIEVPITFHGGEAGFDTLIIEGGSFTSTGFSASGPDSGSLILDDVLIHFIPDWSRFT